MRALFACTLLPALAWASPQLEVKGVPLGSPVQAFAAAVGKPFRCIGTRCGENFRIEDRAMFGPAHVKSVQTDVIDGNVESITITTFGTDFDPLAAAMIEKFGQPKRDVNDRVQNRIGNTFDSRTIGWTFDSGAILMRQRAGKLDESATTFSSTKALDAGAARRADRPKEDARGL